MKIGASTRDPRHFFWNPRERGRNWVFVRIFLIALGVLAITTATIASAQTLGYGSYSGLGLYKGINGLDFEHPLPGCVTAVKNTLTRSASRAVVSIVYSAKDYDRAFHIDQTAKASFLGILGGGDEFHISDQYQSHSTAWSIVIEASGEHDSPTLDQVKVVAPYDADIASGDPKRIESVRNSCGDRFVQTEFLDSRLFVVLSVFNGSDVSRFGVRASGNAQFDLDVVSASGQLGGDLAIATALQNGAISLSVQSEGLGGIVPTLQALQIAQGDSLTTITQKALAYVGTLRDSGAPVAFQLAPIPGLPPRTLTDQRVLDRLQGLQAQYLWARATVADTTNLLQPSDPRYVLLNLPQDAAPLNAYLRSLNPVVDAIAAQFDHCRTSVRLSDCDTPLPTPPRPPSAYLPPLGIPGFSPPGYSVAINGAMQPLGTSAGILSARESLFDAARAVVPAAKNVDVMQLFMAPYLSNVVMLVTPVPPDPKFRPITLGGFNIAVNQLAWPSYVNIPSDAIPIGHVMRILHADATNPCRKMIVGTSSVYEDSCLVDFGIALRELVRADAAASVATGGGQSTTVSTNPPPAGGSRKVGAAYAQGIDCFNMPLFPGPVPIAQWYGDPYVINASGVGTITTLAVWGGSGYIPVWAEQRTTDMSTWASDVLKAPDLSRFTTRSGFSYCSRSAAGS